MRAHTVRLTAWLVFCWCWLCVGPVLAAELKGLRQQFHVVIPCFDFLPATEREDPSLACELSALVHHQGRLWFLNDKSHPSLPVSLLAALAPKVPADGDGASMAATETRLTAFLPGPASPLDQASKFEAAAQSVDDAIDFAVTAFDRFDPMSARYDRFNAVFFWPRGLIEGARLLNPSHRNGQTSSVPLRSIFERQLKAPYYKIEGLAALPGRRLLFGVRETGASFREPLFRFLILAFRYVLDDEQGLRLDDEGQVLADWRPADLFPDQSLTASIQGLGLSSIEYCAEHDQLFFLLSAESDSRMDGFLLSQKRARFEAGEKPTLVRDEANVVLHFSHKPEGMTVVGADCQLLIAHDDDRFLGGTPSRANIREMIYSVIQFRFE
ncbi:MAG: hypothetical protein EBV84_00230 [Betaproteobacteria bacterium]|nr:hypothetical protein [Betaproteobacteria bacterium]